MSGRKKSVVIMTPREENPHLKMRIDELKEALQASQQNEKETKEANAILKRSVIANRKDSLVDFLNELPFVSLINTWFQVRELRGLFNSADIEFSGKINQVHNTHLRALLCTTGCFLCDRCTTLFNY